MEVLASRTLLRSADPERTTAFYRDVLGLAVYREYPGGTVFFAGQGLIEVTAGVGAPGAAALLLQVRDLAATAAELTSGDVPVLRGPRRESWGLDEMWIADPDGTEIVLVEVPDGHPQRTDQRPPHQTR